MPSPEDFAAVNKDIASELEIAKEVYGDALHESDGGFDGATRVFDEVAAALSLHNATPAFTSAIQTARQAGAVDESTALVGPGGIRYFVAVAPESQAEGLATVMGEDRFVTIPTRTAKGEAMVFVASWKPITAASDIDALIGTLPEDPSEVPAEQMLALARGLAGCIRDDDERSLGGVMSAVAQFGEPDPDTMVGTARLAEFESRGRTIRALHGRVNMELWPRYAAGVRELALASPPADEDEIVTGSGGFEAEEAVTVDGGFYGELCAWRSSNMREAIQAWRFSALASEFLRTAEKVAEAGYAWPARFLEYADHDRFTFAVTSPDGSRIGRWHRNADLICDMREHMVVVTRDAAGTPERIEVFPTHEPVECTLEQGGDTAQTIRHLADSLDTYADEGADPPRLTRWALASRIAAGEPLPEPAGGIDLVTGKLLSGTVEDGQHLIRNAFSALSGDMDVMARIGKGKRSRFVRVDREFDLPGEAAHQPAEVSVLKR